MRSFVLITAMLVAPGTAFAGSIGTISDSTGTAGSILTIGTPAPVVVKPAAPTLAPGEELVQIRHAGDKTMIYRTEAWLGGSPVTYVSKASDADLAALRRHGINVASTEPQSLRLAMSNADDIAVAANVDRTTETGALTAVPSAKAAAPLDAASLKLRLKMAEAE